MKQYTINITNNDIDEGMPCCRYGCVVANAAKRSIPDFRWISYSGSGIIYLNRNNCVDVQFKNLELAQYMAAFDKDKTVLPKRFVIELED